ncbi:autotransporter outer membrane beta-barrel domain-containing protein [Pseudolabrys sp. FHR47]|uniref:autotransporter outer membrane beta-barrel domain-containing protein n=1 Tax=Pseudolabrys sp. FHR47 TaxID=2562284 RepID=UPI0010BE3B20|nr:autotransporter outer membrane beta-barrel domain-containing protein [Pseudolabrys sp. FHR47]
MRGGAERRLRAVFLTATTLSIAALPAAAQTAQTWNGNTSTDWFVGTNWDSATAPVAGDSATLDTVTPNPTVIDGASGGYSAVDLNGLNVGFNATGRLTINNGADVAITNNLAVIGGDMSGVATSANGTIILDGAGTTFTVTGTPASGGMIVVGASGTGAFTVQNGAQATTVDSYIGHLQGASGTVTVNNGAWTNSGDIFIGNFGTGIFNLSNGGTVNVGGDTVIGANTGSNGTVNISGATSVWTTTGSTILSGNVTTPGVGGTAALNVSSGGTYTANGEMYVGLVGSGTVNITSGGQVNTTSGITYFGYSAGSTATVIIDGAGSAWNETGSGLIVGGNDGSTAGGNATVTVRNGGALNTGDVIIGNDSTNTSRGTVTVTGVGSTWTANNVFVGWNSIGTINILDRATFAVNTDLSIGTCNCSSGTVTVGGGSTVTIGNNWTIAEGAGGTGAMTISGSGTSVTATGDLQVASLGIGTLTIESGAAATAANIYVGFGAGSNGTATVSGTGSTLTATGDLTVGDSGTGILTVRSGAAVTAVNGIVGNNAGSNGTVSVTGTGSTMTFGGVLFVGLGGIGTGALTISDGAVVNVTGNTFNGDSITVGAGSVLNVGNYSATAGVTTSFGLRGASAGQINAGAGTATLNGTLVVTGHNIARTTYTLVSSSSLGGSTFSTVTYDPLLRNPVLTYTAGDVLLTVDQFLLTSQVPSGANSNQRNVARALDDGVAAGSTLPTALESLFYLSGDTLLTALSQLSGEPGAGAQQSLLTGANLFMTSVFDNAFGNPFGASGQGGVSGGALGYVSQPRVSPAAQEAYAAMTLRDRLPSFEQRWSVWASGYGGSARVSGYGGVGSHDTTSRVYGAAAGATWRASADMLLGFALGGAGSSFSVAGGFGSGKADAFNAALYGRRAIGAGYIATALGYSWQDATTDRTVTAGGTTEQLHAAFRPQTLTARLEGGRRFVTTAFGVTPYAAVQTTSVFMPSYGETATSGTGAFALSYASRTVTVTRGELGARFDKAILLGGTPLMLKAKAAWAHDWNNDPVATATFQQLPGATFTMNGAAPAADSALLSFGADAALGGGWRAGASFDGEFSRTTASYSGKGSLRYAW